MSALRRPLHLNPAARTWTAPASLSAAEASSIAKFHGQFPGGPTRLLRLDQVAAELGVAAVYLKDETSRFGLPSFKVLGASWGTFRALARRLRLPIDAEFAAVKHALARQPVALYATTEGNHGRAVARMASLLSVPAEIHVPADMPESTVASLRDEGAAVVVGKGSYDDAVQTAQMAAERTGGLLVQDFALPGYHDVPKWIVDGYTTMMREIDAQLGGTRPDLVVAPVGVGSLAQAVVSYFKRQPGATTVVMAVEPDTAACLYKSLRRNERVEVKTHSTIMAGLDCGNTSPAAWPVLQPGLDASLTISDYEAHQAAEYLETQGVSAGACAAAPLAAVRRLSASNKASLGLDGNSVVVLLCTEASKDHCAPMDVSVDDAVGLTQALVRIDSANPSLGSVPGPGEAEIARYIAAWLEHRDIETHWIEPVEGRPSVVGVVRGSGGGKSLMFNGHIDTVTTLGYDGAPLSGHIQDGRLYGRGADDMKAGVAAALVALAGAKTQNFRGDVVFAGVADEETMSIGTKHVLEAGWRADGAVVNEPTGEVIVNAHKGFVWLEVDIHGKAAHGSLPGAGVDAITRAGYFLVELGSKAEFVQETFWTDCALLAANGIPVLLWGPKGDGLHGKDEWADVASTERVARALGLLASRFCA